jgi:hypothetical protein
MLYGKENNLSKVKKEEKKEDEFKLPEKKFSLVRDVPYIYNHEELSQWIKPLYVIENHMKSYEDYSIFMRKLNNIIKACFTIKQCREYPVKFKFYNKDNDVHTLELRHFYVNCILWEPFVELNDIHILDKSFIVNRKEIPNINDYINYKIIQILREHNIQNTIINYQVSEVTYNLSRISLDFSQLMNLNFSLKTFIDHYENYPEIKDLMELKFEENAQPHEIEGILKNAEKSLISALTSIPGDPIGIILSSKTGMKTKQLVEFDVSEGLNPTLKGETIPIAMENSTLIGGRNKPSTYFIGSMSSRKSLVMNSIINIVPLYSDIQLQTA